MCEFHSHQVTPTAATQQLSAAAEESRRSFRAGKSSGGCSSGPEQGAADATPEPHPAPPPSPRPSPPRSWQEKGGNWSQVHDDRRMEGHAGLESDLGVQYQDVVLIYLLQAEFQASLPIPISITAFPTSSQYLLVCLLPLAGSDLSNLILPCCPLCPAVLLGSSPFCSSNPPSCSSPRAFAFAMPFPGSFSSVFMSSWVFRTVSP